ncbi:MAG TPA: aldehyde ferredoxin oxidoreductase C-terminal domain-containing protein [Geobacteraceae bacterium]
MKFIRIDMAAQEVAVTDVPTAYRGLGGRGLTSTILRHEVAPHCFPLGKENKLVIAPGLVTGTTAPCSGRTSLGAKSPLTGTIKESNVGGIAGQYLAGHGIKALVVEGKPAEKNAWLLVIAADGVRLSMRNDLALRGNYETVSRLREEYGGECAVISVGPAGEQGAALATVAVCDTEGRPTRHAGRGGMGAVMASKGLKAIVVARPPAGRVVPANEEQFRGIVREFARTLIDGKKALTTYGTLVLVNVVNEAGGLPTRNFSAGCNEHADQFSGERLHKLCGERGGATGHACHRGCVIRCSNVFHNAEGEYVTAGLEYETIALLGSNCGLHDLDQIARLDRLCDDTGIDTMEMGVTLGVAMEGGMIPFGAFEQMQEAIEGVASGSGPMKCLSQGATIAGRILGVERIPAVKGQSLSGYDPRALKGTGVTYATSTMGADHTTGNCLPGRGGVDCHRPEGQVALSRDTQVMSMVCDILGLCVFVGPVVETMPFLAALTGAFLGREVSVPALLAQARGILLVEADFNRLAGVSREQNDLPSFFRTEPLPNNGLVFDVPADEMMAMEYT